MCSGNCPGTPSRTKAPERRGFFVIKNQKEQHTMNNSEHEGKAIESRDRRLVFCDIDRHFTEMNTPQADEALAMICHLSFTDGIVVQCALNEIGQYDFTVGLPSDEALIRPMWALSTGVNASITVFAPTVATSKAHFYHQLSEHMFNVPANDELLEWWTGMVRPLSSRMTICFENHAVALCEVVIDLCTATVHVAEESWSND
jgi:hypothetical protein